MNKFLNKILLLVVVCFCFTGTMAFSSDNVLQAIQVDGVKDSYNIILKSDDVAEVKKTIQAPNKMVLTLKGIRASKTINTIYNNTSSVDSVVVEPVGDETVKISIQANNVSGAGVHFDSLKTPLGVLDNAEKQNKSSDEIVLNGPLKSYTPVYDNSSDEDESGFSIASASSTASRYIKKILKSDKISWTIIFGLFTVIILGGMKTIKGKDNDIKVGLTQSLKEREIELYRNNPALGLGSESTSAIGSMAPSAQSNIAGSSYGLRAYQNGTRSPYVTSEVQRPRPMAAPSINPQQVQQMAKMSASRPMAQNVQGTMQNTIQNSNQMGGLKTAPGMSKPKTANIDSIKFLESMTKIYEKNGRSDLAQGLKTNMKKAKANLA